MRLQLPFRRNETKDASSYWPLENPPVGDTSFLFPVGLDQAVGLPAVLSVIRLLAHAAGLVPLYVLRGQDNEVQERATDTWQWRLLNRRPGAPPMTPFHLKIDMGAQIAGRGEVFLRKFTAGGQRVGENGPRITELLPLRGDRVNPKRQNGDIVFEDYSTDGYAKMVTRTTRDILHIRSFSLDGGVEGISPITAARLAVTGGLRRQEMETMHMTNGIFPGLGFKWPSNVDPEQAQKWIDDIEKKHKSSRNAGKLVFVGGGADLVPIPISLRDAEFAEATKLTIAQVAAMYQIPLPFCVPGERQALSETDWRFFLTFALGPIMQSIAEGLTADQTLFPPGDDDLYVHADTDALLNLDPVQKAAVHKAQIQSGERLVDELRAKDGLGPLPPVPANWQEAPGKVPQITPVGGAENPTFGTTPDVVTTADNSDDDGDKRGHNIIVVMPAGADTESKGLTEALTAAFEALPAANVTVTNEVLPTPIKVDVAPADVKVTNDVQPATVAVEVLPTPITNEVTVVTPARKLKLTRGRDGTIEGAEVTDV